MNKFYIKMYMSPSEYAQIIGNAMSDHLQSSFGSDKANCHLEDLTANASTFMDAVFNFVSYLPREAVDDKFVQIDNLIQSEKYANKGCDPLYDDALDSVMEKVKKVYGEN